MSTRIRLAVFTLLLVFLAGCHSAEPNPASIGRPLNPDETQQVKAAIALMREKHLADQANMAAGLEKEGKWVAARPNDPYIAQSEKAGDTPFAYTLPDDNHPHSPIKIVLASRFFTDADTTAEAALMIHEMGHWKAFVANGSSTEYDGYKAEYDTHNQLGFGQNDGLAYFAMLDGVVQNVVPRDPSYKTYPDVKNYMAQPG